MADTLIVKLSGVDGNGAPTSAREIAGRVNQITFMQPMLRDVEVVIRSCKCRTTRSWLRLNNPADARLARHRFHLIRGRALHERARAREQGQARHRLPTYLFDGCCSETEKCWRATAAVSRGKATVDLGERTSWSRERIVPHLLTTRPRLREVRSLSCRGQSADAPLALR